ncbi:MAG: hypothetical protein WBM44_21245 [Waterburya sp.]
MRVIEIHRHQEYYCSKLKERGGIPLHPELIYTITKVRSWL